MAVVEVEKKSTSNSSKKKTTASSSSPMERRKENYLVSLQNLFAFFVVSAMMIFYLDSTAFIRWASYSLKQYLWFRMTDTTVFAIAFVYFLIVMWHLNIRSSSSIAVAKQQADRKGALITTLLVYWNYFLCIFSMMMLVGVSLGCLRIINQHGFYAYFCDGELGWQYASNGDSPIGVYMALFMVSKIPELVDTMFMVVRGRPIRFLHWYHHLTVLLYCWLITRTTYPGTPFSLLNAFVHSVMYYYYARTAQGVRPQFAKFVTLIQLIQMIAGLLISITFAIMWYASKHSDYPCDGGVTMRDSGALPLVLISTAAMYFSYFLLFAQFYLERYRRKQ